MVQQSVKREEKKESDVEGKESEEEGDADSLAACTQQKVRY